MMGFIVAVCQLYVAYLIFRWSVKKMMEWDNRDQTERLEKEAIRAKQLSDAVLKRIDDAQQSIISPRRETRELDDLLLIDAMNREARAKASLIAVLREHGCDEVQINEVLARIDNQQHVL